MWVLCSSYNLIAFPASNNCVDGFPLSSFWKPWKSVSYGVRQSVRIWAPENENLLAIWESYLFCPLLRMTNPHDTCIFNETDKKNTAVITVWGSAGLRCFCPVRLDDYSNLFSDPYLTPMWADSKVRQTLLSAQGKKKRCHICFCTYVRFLLHVFKEVFGYKYWLIQSVSPHTNCIYISLDRVLFNADAVSAKPPVLVKRKLI